MMRSWPTKKLGEIAQLRMGETLIKKDLTGDGLSVYSADSLDKPWGFTSKSKLKFSRGSIVVGARGTIGSIKLPEDKEFVSTQTTIIISPYLEIILSEFLYYYLATINFKKITAGSGIPMLTIGHLKRIKVPFPPLPIQQKIVERLDAIRKAQELNDKQIALTEELFQSLLHRELDPKGKNWEVKRLGEITKIGSGNSAPQDKKYFVNGTIPFFRTADVGRVHFSSDLSDTTDLLNKKAIKELGLRVWPKGTILFPKSGASIFLNHRVMIGTDGVVSGHLATILTESYTLQKYIFYFLATIDAKTLIADQNYPALRITDLQKLKIFLPPLEIQKKIVEKLSAVQEYKKKLLKQKHLFQELFESVLNKSFKGEI